MSRWGRMLIAAVLVVSAAACDRPAGGGRRPAPPLTGELLEGGSYSLADHRGEVVVVNFWASWCAPCRAEIDDLEETYRAVKTDGVSFVGVNIRDPDRDKAKAFVDGRVSYPSVYDSAGKVSLGFAEFGATTIPATVIVDREGRVAHVLRDAVHRETLEPLVAAVAKEPRP